MRVGCVEIRMFGSTGRERKRGNARDGGTDQSQLTHTTDVSELLLSHVTARAPVLDSAAQGVMAPPTYWGPQAGAAGAGPRQGARRKSRTFERKRQGNK